MKSEKVKMKSEKDAMSWEIKRLGDFVNIKTGKLDANSSSNDGIYPFFTCSKEPLKISSYTYDCECVLVAGNGDLNVKYYEGKFDAYQRTYIVETLNKETLNVRYLYYFLDTYLEKLREQSIGGVIKYIKLENLSDAKIPLPPLAIQKRIAKILDAADALRRKDQELLKKYDELAQAIFIDMFGDPVKNEKGWEVKKLGELFSKPVKCGPFGSALKKEEYVKEGIPVWIMDNIQDYNFIETGCLYISEEKYLDLTTYSAVSGDIIISRAGTVGKMCVIDSEFEKSIISTNLIKLTLNDKLLNSYYFVRLMKYFGKKIGRLRTGSEDGFTHMNTGVLAGLEFPLPSIEKQHDYLNILKNINNQISLLNTNTEELFQNLLQKAFKGELVE